MSLQLNVRLLLLLQSYYERLQEITRQEVAEQEEETTAVTDYQPTNLLQHAPALPGASDAAAAESGSQQEQDQEAAMGGSQGGRKRKAPRSSIKQGTGTAGADDSSHPAGEASTAAAVAAATGVAGLPSKRRATAAAAAAAGRAASPKAGRPASRDAATAAAIAGTSRRRTLASAAGSAAAAARSPAPAVAAGRPGSSRANAIAACDSTPAAQNGAITERPPWSVGGPAAAAAGVVAGAAGATGAAAATGKADRGALQKLQAAYDAKVEELAAVKEQLKESQVGLAISACWVIVKCLLPVATCMWCGLNPVNLGDCVLHSEHTIAHQHNPACTQIHMQLHVPMNTQVPPCTLANSNTAAAVGKSVVSNYWQHSHHPNALGALPLIQDQHSCPTLAQCCML